jgi:hypothetical protein
MRKKEEGWCVEGNECGRKWRLNQKGKKAIIVEQGR